MAPQMLPMPDVYAAMPSTQTLSPETEPVPAVVRESELPPERARLLGSTRGASAGMSPAPQAEDGIQAIRYLMETAISKLDGLAERPIAVSVSTYLDGRQVAQSVYKDLRERKVKNYETL